MLSFVFSLVLSIVLLIIFSIAVVKDIWSGKTRLLSPVLSLVVSLRLLLVLSFVFSLVVSIVLLIIFSIAVVTLLEPLINPTASPHITLVFSIVLSVVTLPLDRGCLRTRNMPRRRLQNKGRPLQIFTWVFGIIMKFSKDIGFNMVTVSTKSLITIACVISGLPVVRGLLSTFMSSFVVVCLYELTVQLALAFLAFTLNFFKDEAAATPLSPRRMVVSAIFFSMVMIMIMGIEHKVPDARSWDGSTIRNVEVFRCYDGDTCTVNIPGDMPSVFSESIPIRILGIDTPEIRGQCAKEKALAIKARDEARKFVVGKKVILSNVQRDKYFRLVADMSTDEGDLATRLLDLNLAVPYDGGTKSSTWC